MCCCTDVPTLEFRGMGRRGPQPVGPATVRTEPRARATSVGGLDSGAWKGAVAQFPRGRRRRCEHAMVVEQRVERVGRARAPASNLQCGQGG